MNRADAAPEAVPLLKIVKGVAQVLQSGERRLQVHHRPRALAQRRIAKLEDFANRHGLSISAGGAPDAAPEFSDSPARRRSFKPGLPGLAPEAMRGRPRAIP